MSSLEEERQSILHRMQLSREHYRRMLLNQPEVHANPHHPAGHHASYALANDQFPRSKAMRWVAQHPVLCAAAVAAVIAIGPARLARTAMKGGNAAGTLTARAASNIDNLTRILGMVATVVQSMQAARHPPR